MASINNLIKITLITILMEVLVFKLNHKMVYPWILTSWAVSLILLLLSCNSFHTVCFISHSIHDCFFIFIIYFLLFPSHNGQKVLNIFLISVMKSISQFFSDSLAMIWIRERKSMCHWLNSIHLLYLG